MAFQLLRSCILNPQPNPKIDQCALMKPLSTSEFRFIVEGIVDVWQSLVDACGRLIDLRRALHVQGLVRTLLVEDLDELVEPSLLLQKIGSRRLGGFSLQGQMHAFMAAVLLGVARLNPLDANTEPEPPDRE